MDVRVRTVHPHTMFDREIGRSMTPISASKMKLLGGGGGGVKNYLGEGFWG